MASTVSSLIVAAAQQFGVQPALALEVATAESNLNPNISDSPAGAIGVMQLMPATAAQLGVNPRDVTQNIQGGVKYLAQLLGQFSDVTSALAAYNWGPTNVSKAISKYGSNWLAYAPAETQNYVAKILNGLGTQYTVTVDPPAAEDASSDDNTDPTQAGCDWCAALPSSSATPVWLLAAAGLLAFLVWESAW